MSKRRKIVSAGPKTPVMNVRLTIDERDAIDAAKDRILHVSALLAAIDIHLESPLEGTGYDDDAERARGHLLHLIFQDACVLRDSFQAADAREKSAR